MTNVRSALQDAYHSGYYRLGELRSMAGISESEAVELTFASPHTYRRWKTDRKPNRCAVRLLAVCAGFIPWRGWERWFYNRFDQKLYCDDLKYGFSTDELTRYHYVLQAYRDLEAENQYLRQRLKDLDNRLVHTGRAVRDNPNVLAFPTLANMWRAVVPSESPASDPKPGLWDRFTRFGRRKTG